MTNAIAVARDLSAALGFPVLTADVQAVVASIHRHYGLGLRDALPNANGLVLAEREACAALAASWNTAMTDKLAAAICARGAS